MIFFMLACSCTMESTINLVFHASYILFFLKYISGKHLKEGGSFKNGLEGDWTNLLSVTFKQIIFTASLAK